MGKPQRSPLLGYNHNFTHLGRVFHIQTEDSGPATPRLFTHLFYEGTILASRKTEYNASLPDDQVRALMQGQHKTVIRDLLRARLDERIIAFFAARGEDVGGAQGAVPEAPLVETSGTPMVLPEALATTDGGGVPIADSAAPVALDGSELDATAPEEAVLETGDSEEAALEADASEVAAPEVSVPKRTGPRRTSTRAIEGAPRGLTPTPVVVRPPDMRRSPFVRNAAPAPAKMSSTDGVVVQRNVVVGGGPGSTARPARIRPPVPYVVTGGGHTQRPPQPATGHSPAPTPAAATQPSPPSPPISAPVAVGEAPARKTRAFGTALADDKSLDEVILEYLSEDGEAG